MKFASSLFRNIYVISLKKIVYGAKESVKISFPLDKYKDLIRRKRGKK